MSLEAENHLSAAYKSYSEACDSFLGSRIYPWLGVLSPLWGKVLRKVLNEKEVEKYQKLLQGYSEKKTSVSRWWYGLRHGVKKKSIHLRYQIMQEVSKQFLKAGGLKHAEARAGLQLSLQSIAGWLRPKVDPVKGLFHRITGAFWGWVKGIEKASEAKAPAFKEETSTTSHALVKVATRSPLLNLNFILSEDKASEDKRISEAFEEIAWAFTNWLREMSYLLWALKSGVDRESYEKTFQEAKDVIKHFKRAMLLVYHPDKVQEEGEREIRGSCFKVVFNILEMAQSRLAEIDGSEAVGSRFEEIVFHQLMVAVSHTYLRVTMRLREVDDILKSNRTLIAGVVKEHLAMRERVVAIDARITAFEKLYSENMKNHKANRESINRELAESRARQGAVVRAVVELRKSQEATDKKLDAVEKELLEARVSRKAIANGFVESKANREAAEKELIDSRVSQESTEKKLAELEKALEETSARRAATDKKVTGMMDELMKLFQSMQVNSRLEFDNLTKSSSKSTSSLVELKSVPVINEVSSFERSLSTLAELSSNSSLISEKVTSVLIQNDTYSSGSYPSNDWTEDSRSECFSEAGCSIDSTSSSRYSNFFKTFHIGAPESDCVENALVQ